MRESSRSVGVEIRWDDCLFPSCRDYNKVAERRRKAVPRASNHFDLSVSVPPLPPGLLYELVVRSPLNSNLERSSNAG